MKVHQIYGKYSIPPNLQKHMLRVAALSEILALSWKDERLDTQSIVLACLFHDMANIIKFKLDKPPLFKEEAEQVNYWKKVQQKTIEKYGTDIHIATLAICKEIGLSDDVICLVRNLEWDNTLKMIEKKDYRSSLCIYSDMRIGPFGIMSIQDRINNLQTRNSSHDFNEILKSACLLEDILKQHIQICINTITDDHISGRFGRLLEIEV